MSPRIGHPPHFFSITYKGKKSVLDLALQRGISASSFQLLLMRLKQGRSTGGFRVGGRLVSLWWKEHYPSGQSRPMGVLHLGYKCLVCVEPFPVADRQEDTSAKLLGQFIPQYKVKNTPKGTPPNKGYEFLFFFIWKVCLL